MRCGHCVPPEIAEGPGGGFDKCSRIVPSSRRRVRSVAAACQRKNRAIITWIARAGIIDAADGDVLRDAALNRRTCAQLPATSQRIDGRTLDVQELAASAYRKIITAAEHEPVACVECGESPLTP